MKIQGVHHVAIKTARVNALTAFYKTVLGLEETHRNIDARGLYSVWLAMGGSILMIERSDDGLTKSSDSTGLHMLALTIESPEHDSWRARFASHGVDVEATTEYTTYVRDPDGNRIGMSSWPNKSTP